MSAVAGVAFDRVAAEYDALWTTSAIGRLQRRAFWHRIDPLVRPADRVLDLGCGTGEDALHMMERGAIVSGIDASREMVRVARARGVNAQQLTIESLGSRIGARTSAGRGLELPSSAFDGAISNFGALNCVTDLEPVADALRRLIRPGGFLAICLMGTRCAWETGHFLLRGDPRRAFRRWRRGGTVSSFDVRVTYPGIRQVNLIFRPWFKPAGRYGIGLCVPPSYVGHLRQTTLARLGRIDAAIAWWPVLRALSDHQLHVFERI
jgi:ubiquinone/menaquinone biosynthesis C-methylase UbiE